ncbi:hypothetical protein TNCV_358661 [Trichonephila clavipes]|nr:hypothetical protein TNCV_358661 [Trichonephila clavipes]
MRPGYITTCQKRTSVETVSGTGVSVPKKAKSNIFAGEIMSSHADSFPSQMMHFLHPCLEFFDILLRHQGCILWLAEQKIYRQTISSYEHLGWGIAGGLVNGTPVGKQENGQFLVPVLLITGYGEKGCSGWSD